MKSLLFFVASVLLMAGCSHSTENAVSCIQLDPLKKVFNEELYFMEFPDTAEVAKGETATFQFVIKGLYPIEGLKVEAGDLVNGDRRMAATLKAFVGYVRAGTHADLRSRHAVLPASDFYPDCLQEVDFVDVLSTQNQPVWVSYAIPRSAKSGNYAANLVFTGTINGQPFKITKQVNAKVYPVTLPEQTLWISNHWNLGELPKMNGNQPVEFYSDRYWELLTVMVNVLRDHGQNMYIIDLGRDCALKRNGAQFSWDFTNFDKTVELFIREGNLKRIEGAPLAARMPDDPSNLGISIPHLGYRPIDNDTAQIFLSQFLPALHSHLKSKGWEKMYVQHIFDEPMDYDLQKYSRVADFVKKYMPGIPIIDALAFPQLYVDVVDILVPVLNAYHQNYALLQERQAAGKEVLFYTGVSTQNNYANRFLELPLIQNRLLSWINFRFGSTGYLNWGLNYWNEGVNPADFTNEHGWPAGDAWITYPAEGKLYSSIRLAAMRDGIADYELLKLFEKKAPDKAKKMVSDYFIHDFNNYNNEISFLRRKRSEILKLLSE